MSESSTFQTCHHCGNNLPKKDLVVTIEEYLCKEDCRNSYENPTQLEFHRVIISDQQGTEMGIQTFEDTPELIYVFGENHILEYSEKLLLVGKTYYKTNTTKNYKDKRYYFYFPQMPDIESLRKESYIVTVEVPTRYSLLVRT